MPKQYRLTDGDKAIIQKAVVTKNPNWFFNHYLRSASSGTWWRPVLDEDVSRLIVPEFRAQALRWQEGYAKLFDVWSKLGQPEFFAPVEGKWQALNNDQYVEMLDELDVHYRVVYELTATDPVFHHNHGFIMLPWQLEMFNAKPFLRVVPGGYGSGKTMAAVAGMLYYAAVLRGFRGFAFAPNSIQTDEVYEIAMALLSGTLYEERFLVKAPRRPRPVLHIGHDHVGNSKIECIPLADDPSKPLTVTGDLCIVDQCEKIQDLDELLRVLGTRFRGTLHGRPKVGTMTLLANSADNAALWSLFDEAEENPKEVWAFSPPTTLNVYLTIEDMIRYQRYVGTDEDARRMYIYGGRPMGSGVHFSNATLTKCRDNELTELIQLRSEEPVPSVIEEKRDPVPGYIWREAPKIGCYYFETPYISGHQYMVAADPGWNNPPKRDSAVIGVFDITNFPYAPAQLVAFAWVFGNHDPNPWIMQYIEFVTKYKAFLYNGFDSTGQQAGYEKLQTGLHEYNAQPITMAGGRKFSLLTLTKILTSRGLYRFPYVPALFNQLVNYVIPDEKIVQDAVAMLMVASALLEWIYYAVYGQEEQKGDEEEEKIEPPDYNDRYARPLEERYDAHER